MKSFTDNYANLKFILLALLVGSLPYYFQISNILIAFSALLTVSHAIVTRRFDISKPSLLSLTLIGYFTTELLGLFSTDRENMRYGISILDKHQAMLLLPLAFVDFEVTSKQRDTLLNILIGSLLVGSLICIAVNIHLSLKIYNMYVHSWQFSHLRLAAPISMEPVYLAMYLSFAVLVITHRLMEKFPQLSVLQKISLILVMIYFLIFIVALGARTVAVSLIIISTGVLIIYAFARKSYVPILIALAMPVIFAGFISFHPIVKTRFLDVLKNTYENTNYGSYFARLKIWEPGLEAIHENFWFGVGTGDHQTELNRKFTKYGYDEGVKNLYNMHNQYLQVQLNHGIFGLLIFLFLLAIQIKRALHERDLLYLSFMCLFILSCLTESMLNRNKGVIFFLVFSLIYYNQKKHTYNLTIR